MADQPTMREYSILSLVMAADPEHFEKEVVYEFGEREFVSTDRSTSGIYD